MHLKLISLNILVSSLINKLHIYFKKQNNIHENKW